jgi:hypothetical protein
MIKTIAHNIIFEVNGFEQARAWIYRAVRAGVVKCGQCSEPATHVFWQDQAEWYCRCTAHREYGDMWTGSTHWHPHSFGLVVISESAALAWRDSLPPDEQALITVEQFDATNYYNLLSLDAIGRHVYTRHYLRGSAEQKPSEWVDIYPLTNGEFAYQRGAAYGYHVNTYGICGAWASEIEALEAAKVQD